MGPLIVMEKFLNFVHENVREPCAMQGRNNWGLGVLLKDTLTHPGGSNRLLSDCQVTALTP